MNVSIVSIRQYLRRLLRPLWESPQLVWLRQQQARAWRKYPWGMTVVGSWLGLSLWVGACWLVGGAPSISELREGLQASMAAAPAALATLSVPSVRRLIWIVVLVVVGGLAVQIGAIVLQDRPWQAWRRRRGWSVRESLDIAPRRGPRG